MKRLLLLLSITLAAPGSFAEEAQPLSAAEQQQILARLEHPLIGDCQKYYEFDVFLQILLNGDIQKDAGTGMKQQFAEYMKSFELKLRSPEALPAADVKAGCNGIARGITEAQLMRTQLVIGVATVAGEAIGKAFGEIGKVIGQSIGESLKSIEPAK